jgi:quercetin dioxygenase-like cupin family protein
MNFSRRELSLGLATLLASRPALSATGQKLPAKAYPFQDLPVRIQGGNQFRPVLDGDTHSGFYIELHETTLAAGSRPHPPHHHLHEEIFLVQEGTVEVTMAGETTPLGPGSVAYVASNVEHGIKNAGSGPAHYFVMALGTDHS